MEETSQRRPRRRKHKRRRETPQQIARTRRRHVWLLGLITVLVYLSALPGDFVWTDQENILQGQYRLTTAGDTQEMFTLPGRQYRERFDGAAPDLNHGTWQPAAVLSNTLSWLLWRDNSVLWHLENLFWHLLVVLGLYVVGRHVASQHRLGNSMAFWAATLFAVHPSGVSTVAWIGGRPELLAAALGVASLAFFTRLQATTNTRRQHHNRWMIGIPVFGLLAMLANENAYLLPAAALLIAVFSARIRGRPMFSGIAPRRWYGLFALFGMLGLVLLYRDLFVGGLNFAGDYPTGSFFNNLGTALRHLWKFVEQTLLPSEPVISDAWAISHGWDAGEVAAVLGTVLLLAATGLGFALGNPAAFGVAWFLLWIIPGVGFFPTDYYHSDQYLYLASWGLIFAVVYGISRAWRPVGRQLVPGSEVLVFGPVLIVLFLITAFSNARWWDHQRLFESEIASDPHYIEGRIRLAEHDLRENRPLDALNHVLEAIESHKKKQFTGYWDTANTYRLLGEIQLKLGMSHDAVNSLDIALEARPGSARSWHLLGLAHLDNGNYAEAEQGLRRSLEIRPGNRGVEADLGVALLGQDKSGDGRSILVQALQHPGIGNFRRHSALGISLVEEQQFAAARPHLEQALDAREVAKTRAALAYVLWQLGEQDDAYESLSMAMQNDAQGADDYINWVNQQISNQSVLLPGS